MTIRNVFRVVSALALVCGVLSALPMGAQTPATGTIIGTVRAAPTGVALPYAVITIPALARERFSGANGQFVMTEVPAGTHAVTVRRIGFVPQQLTVTVTAGGTSTLDPQLVQIPVRLTGMTVRPVEPCTAPGVPDPKKFPEVAQLVALLRENAATYQSLATQHPYAYAELRALATMTRDTMQLTSLTAERIEGTKEARYRPGRVVTRSGNGPFASYVMTLPTILDLVDKTFIDNHCFRFGGLSVNGSETWVRLDIRAADNLRTPDVHGSFYLDSATAQLRRMELDLSRVDRLPASLKGIRAVQATTTFLEIAPGLSIINNVCGINWTTSTSRFSAPQHPSELQQVVAVQFASPPPDVPARQEFEAPRWAVGIRIARDRLSCAEQR